MKSGRRFSCKPLGACTLGGACNTALNTPSHAYGVRGGGVDSASVVHDVGDCSATLDDDSSHHFANTSNTCYIIAWMECMLQFPWVRRILAMHGPCNAALGCSACAFEECVDMLDICGSTANAEPWKPLLDTTDTLTWGQEQDILEFWLAFRQHILPEAHNAQRWSEHLGWQQDTRVLHECHMCSAAASTTEVTDLLWSVDHPRDCQGNTHNGRGFVVRIPGAD